jgi:2-oxoglutarate ferredoxin oxidoreductase subunit gamma
VLYPYLTRPDILVVMSQEAYTRFTPELKEGGILLVEEDLVRLENLPQHLKVYGIPATRLAEKLGKKMVLNVVMVGFLCAISQVVSLESCRQSVNDSVPARFRELNLSAFDEGHTYGLKVLESGPMAEDNDADAEEELESVD